MAELCRQCTRDLVGLDMTDFAGSIEQGFRAVLCEGCGLTRVNALGECMNDDGHHLDERSFGRMMAWMALIGVCPYRYSREGNVLEVWLKEVDAFGDHYTRVMMSGSILTGSSW